MKLHKQEYKYQFPEKKLSDVNLEKVQRTFRKYISEEHPIHNIIKDNGRVVIVIMNREMHKLLQEALAEENMYGDTWLQYGEEKEFDIGGHIAIVAEFWTDQKFDYESDGMVEAASDFYLGTKRSGRESIYDVYNDNELL